jgi:hypothetical protein
MSGCGARTATRSLDAVFESSDVEHFGWIGSWSSRYILLWIAKDQKYRPDAASQSQAGMAGARDMRVKLTRVNDSQRFRAQHYV